MEIKFHKTKIKKKILRDQSSFIGQNGLLGLHLHPAINIPSNCNAGKMRSSPRELWRKGVKDKANGDGQS